jgi:hypothetical protein
LNLRKEIVVVEIKKRVSVHSFMIHKRGDSESCFSISLIKRDSLQDDNYIEFIKDSLLKLQIFDNQHDENNHNKILRGNEDFIVNKTDKWHTIVGELHYCLPSKKGTHVKRNSQSLAVDDGDTSTRELHFFIGYRLLANVGFIITEESGNLGMFGALSKHLKGEHNVSLSDSLINMSPHSNEHIRRAIVQNSQAKKMTFVRNLPYSGQAEDKYTVSSKHITTIEAPKIKNHKTFIIIDKDKLFSDKNMLREFIDFDEHSDYEQEYDELKIECHNGQSKRTVTFGNHQSSSLPNHDIKYDVEPGEEPLEKWRRACIEEIDTFLDPRS